MSLGVLLFDTGVAVAIAWLALFLAGGFMAIWGQCRLWRRVNRLYSPCLCIANMASGLGSALQSHWGSAAVNGALAAFLAWLWWRQRRKDRKRALGLAGYKARAALAALVRKAREASKPRPVLRPIPGSAR
jgi:hypothetical protein